MRHKLYIAAILAAVLFGFPSPGSAHDGWRGGGPGFQGGGHWGGGHWMGQGNRAYGRYGYWRGRGPVYGYRYYGADSCWAWSPAIGGWAWVCD